MPVLKTAVLRQIAYARSVRSVIRAIMRRMLDGEWIDRIFASSDDEFNNRLDEALKSLDLVNATRRDFCGAVVGVLCGEVSDLCLALKDVCDGSGYSDYYESHISHERFVRLVLSVDTVKLGRMKKVLEDAKLSPIDVLRGVGSVLNDEPIEDRAALDAGERRRANAELKSIAEATKRAIDAVGEKVDAVGAKIEAVGRKVTKLRGGGEPRGRYAPRVRDICWNYWTTAANREEVWRSVNTRITYEAVFRHYAVQLARVGVESAAAFANIIRAESRRRNRELSTSRQSNNPNDQTTRQSKQFGGSPIFRA